ncbi:MAG: monovalent cation:proton antiporter-2 (CPA2) family protein [Gemmatimonadetes bacterium]|nr:monovalent cation:proton antiporter-2 (CPA2) family protein [Gemmatimonadota bacterium]
MHGQGFFFQAFVYLAAAVIAVPIAKRMGLGSVLGYLIAGMVIGPYGFGLIGEEGKDVLQFAEFGVVMMLFIIGLELQPALLWRLRRPILGTGGLQVAATTVLIASIAVAVGFPWQASLAVGLTLSLSSTAIVLQTLSEKGLMKSEGGQTAFSVLLFQDMAFVPMLAILPLLAVAGGVVSEPGSHQPGTEAAMDGMAEGVGQAASHSATWADGLSAGGQTVMVFGAVVAVVLLGRYLVRPAFRVIAGTNLRELFTAAALLLIIGIALLMAQVGLSPALGAFLGGVVLANSEYRHELEVDLDPFKGLLLAVFFIAVGASVDFGLIGRDPGTIALLVGGLVLVKAVVLFLLGRIFGMGLDQNLLFTFALAQGGEFGFVLFSFAGQLQLIPADTLSLLIAVVATSMALTPILMVINERMVQPRFGTKESTEAPADQIDEEGEVIIVGFGRMGSVTGRFLRANGIKPTVLEHDSDRVETLRALGLKVFYGDGSRHDLLRAAGAARAKILIIAVDDHGKVRKILDVARKHFPHLTILSRVAGRPEAYELLEQGVEHVYREGVETALRVGVGALKLLGRPAHQVQRASRTFFRHDEDSVRDLGKMRHDRAAYFSAARERISTLEELMLSELEGEGEERDAGWDTESLREEFGEPDP